MRRMVLALALVGLAALMVLAACAKATPTATPRPATPTSVPPTAVPTRPGTTPTAVPPTPTTSPAVATFRAAKQKFETETIPAALKEGSVTWYTCHQELNAQDNIKTFNKLYPGIKIDYVYDNPGPLIARIDAEVKAGKVIADVYNCGGTSVMTVGWRGQAEEFIAPTAMNPDVQWAGQMTPTSNGPTRTNWGYQIGSVIINTDMVSKDHYPVSWWDIVKDPFWQGKVTIANPFAPGFLGQFHYIWLEQKKDELGEKFVQALSAMKPAVIKTGAADMVARGEIYMNIGSAGYTPYVAPWKGSPMTAVFPKEGVYAVAWLGTVVKGAPHPNAAKVFLDSWLSPEMQTSDSNWGRVPMRAGTKLGIPEIAIEKLPLAGWGTEDAEKIIGTYYKMLDEKGYYK